MSHSPTLLYDENGEAKRPYVGMTLGIVDNASDLTTWAKMYAKRKISVAKGTNSLTYGWICGTPGCPWHLKVRKSKKSSSWYAKDIIISSL